MTPGGWLVMIASVGGATCFFVFCIVRVLKAKDAAKPHSPDEADDEDLDGGDEGGTDDEAGESR